MSRAVKRALRIARRIGKKYADGGDVFAAIPMGPPQKFKTPPEKSPNERVAAGHQEFEKGYVKGWDTTNRTKIMNMRGQELEAIKIAEGGPVRYSGSSEESEKLEEARSSLPYGKHRLDLSVPITRNTDLTGRLDAAPDMYGPGRHDVGVRAGFRYKFADGGVIDPEDEARAFADRPEGESWDPPFEENYPEPEPVPLPRPRPGSDVRQNVARLAAHTHGSPQPDQLGRPAGTGEESVREYHPTTRENIGAYLVGEHPSNYRRRLVKEGVGSTGLGEHLSVSDVTPIGMGLQLQEALQHGDPQSAALAVVPGMGPVKGVAKAGKEAVHYWSQNIADELVHRHGQHGYEGINEALYRLADKTSPKASDAVFAKLPEEVRQGIIEHIPPAEQVVSSRAAARHESQAERAFNEEHQRFLEGEAKEYEFHEHPDYAPLVQARIAANRRAESLRGTDEYRLARYQFEQANQRENQAYREYLDRRTRTGQAPQSLEQIPSGPEHEIKHPIAPRFREITHPEEAKDWLRDRGHNPDDWGYSDPENYVELANRLKKEEMGLKPPTSQTPASPVSRRRPTPSEDPHEDFNALADDLKIAEAEFNAGEGASKPDLEHLFQTMGASDVAGFPEYLMTEIRKGLSNHPNPERLRAKDENLWNALHQRFDDMDQHLDERAAWAGEPRRERPEATVTPIHPGPFAYTTEYGTPLSQRDVNRLSTYFDETMRSRTGNRGPLFKDQEDFANDYFGGMNTKRVTAILTSDPHGSNSPAFRFQGSLLNPNNREFVAEIDRYIIPEQKYAYHGLLSVEPKYQSGEFAPQMLRNQIDLYKKLDLNYVSLGAGLDSGPYTWIKYGWIPNQHGWDTIRQRTQNYLNGGQLKVSNPQVREGLNKILSDRDPRSAWDLADITAKDDFGNEIGRTIFLGYKTRNSRNIRFDAQGWRGQLNLKNTESMERFDAYFRRQTEKKAGKAKPKSE